MMVIGLTGSFGTGKSFVASVFRSLGAKVVDADSIAHKVIRRGSPAYSRIVRLFGRDVLNSANEIDRKKLGEQAFRDAGLLGKLNRIVHPEVIRRIKRSIAEVSKKDVVVIDAPLLVEAGLDRCVDKLIVVKCSKRRQIERCQEKFCMEREGILRRIASQIPLKKKIKMADFVINNNQTRSRTKRQVQKVWEEMSWK
ncbi:MAG: dephospho-CoA kinase [Candidatus Omnitrophica bacterium]|nr:dephospho-CoA kinase [Candidatus Omnitrophota bacterium]MDD5436609.1 dephospho-CoA kinase [Candidatus Omnitrophota bacterium]